MIIKELERTQELVKEGFISQRLGNYITAFLEMESHVFDSLKYLADGDLSHSSMSRGLAESITFSLGCFGDNRLSETREVIPGAMWAHGTSEKYIPLLEHMNERFEYLDNNLIQSALQNAIHMNLNSNEAAA